MASRHHMGSNPSEQRFLHKLHDLGVQVRQIKARSDALRAEMRVLSARNRELEAALRAQDAAECAELTRLQDENAALRQALAAREEEAAASAIGLFDAALGAGDEFLLFDL
jgi:hypothetical protein